MGPHVFLCILYFNETVVFLFYFMECRPAGQLHKMFAAPIFPLLIPLAGINSSENELYKGLSWVSLPETLASQQAAAFVP